MCRVRITWWTRSTSKAKQQAGLLKFARFHKQFPSTNYGLVKIKTRWQNRHVDNCGLYENDKCCKVCKFGKDSSKVCENCLLMISNFYKNNNLGENGEFGTNLSKVLQKLRQDDKRRMSLIVGFYENAIFSKSMNFGKNTSKVWQNSNETKGSILYK